MVVNVEVCRTRISVTLYPFTPQNLATDEEGEGVVDGAVDVASAGVIEMSEDSLEAIEMEVDVDESLGDEEFEAVLVVLSLVDVESRVELEDEALLEPELDELEVEDLAEDTTPTSHFPNPP